MARWGKDETDILEVMVATGKLTILPISAPARTRFINMHSVLKVVIDQLFVS